MEAHRKSQIVHTPLGTIEYCWEGSGPVVLVCHGTSNNCYSDVMNRPLIEAGYSVLTPSRPGYGRTPLQTGRTAAQAADALAALLDCLRIDHCAVIAISGGGPTGIALAARHPERVSRLVLMAAVADPGALFRSSAFERQRAFYGPMHGFNWGMLGLISRISPRAMARQTMTIFSSHDPGDALARLDEGDIASICRFYQGSSSRQGAVNDQTHSTGETPLEAIHVPTLVIHSREDAAVPFAQAETALAQISGAELCEGGLTGHFLWVGPEKQVINRRLLSFLKPWQIGDYLPIPAASAA